MDNLAKQTKFHYGWVILVLVCIMPFVAFWAGVPIGLYTLPVSEDLGVTRGVYSYGGSWQNIVSMILATQFARINNKLDQRRTVILGGCCYSLGMLLFSFATNMIWVYIARSFIAAGYAFACYTCMALLINNWFAKKTGTFLGIAHMFGNVGSIIMSTVFATWIENAGWRNSMRFTAIGYAIPIILYILFLRSKPSDMGLKPLFFDENASVDTRTLQGEDFATGKKSGKFFGMLFLIFLVGLTTAPIITFTLAPHMADRGMTLAQQGLATSLVLVGTGMFQVPAGIVADKYGSRWVFIFIMALDVLGVVGLFMINASAPWIAYVTAILLGSGMVTMTSVQPIMATELFGLKNLKQFQSYNIFAQAAGAVLGPILLNGLYDALGSYSLIHTIYAFIFVFMAVLAVLITRKKNIFVFTNED